MADNAIALQVKTPDVIGTIGGMLDAARSIQAYKQGGVNLARTQATLEADIARSKAESSTAQSGATVAAANVQPLIAQQAAQTSTAQTGATSAQWKLNSEQATKGYEIAGGLLNDPAIVKGDSKGAVDALMHAEEQMRAHGIPEPQIRVQMAPLYALAGHQPQQLQQTLANIVKSGMGAGSQAQMGMVPVRGQQQPGGSDISGNPTAIVKDQFGNIQQAPLPVAPQSGGQPAPAMRVPPGELPLTPDHPLVRLRDTAQASAAAAPQQHFNNQQILQLAPEAFTGSNSGFLKDWMGKNGLQWTNDAAANTAQLQHFMALQVEQNASAQGANTDAARKMAADAVLPGSSPEKAIKAITKVNDAYVTGNELFNAGLQSAVRNSPNGLYAGRQFQNAWSQNMDPRIFQIENAAKAGDKAEITRIKAQLGPSGVAELTRKAHALRELIGDQNGP